MVDPATLSDFIQYSKAKYPADRYMLVLWDHGGGSLTGYGYDQNFPNDSMTLDEIGHRPQERRLHLRRDRFRRLPDGHARDGHGAGALRRLHDRVGGDRAGHRLVLHRLADGPAQNTSMPTTDLGKKLIDDYVASCKTKTPQSQATLSLIDLAELKGTVPSRSRRSRRSTNGLIDANSYQTVSDARADAKEFAASSQINQIDLIDFAENLGTPEATVLRRGAARVHQVQPHDRRTSSNANGVSIYFPYGRLSQLNSMLSTYDQIGIAAEYSECIRSYASVAAGGQVTSSGGGDMLDSLLGGLLGRLVRFRLLRLGSSGAGGGGSSAEAVPDEGDFSSITGRRAARPAGSTSTA